MILLTLRLTNKMKTIYLLIPLFLLFFVTNNSYNSEDKFCDCSDSLTSILQEIKYTNKLNYDSYFIDTSNDSIILVKLLWSENGSAHSAGAGFIQIDFQKNTITDLFPIGGGEEVIYKVEKRKINIIKKVCKQGFQYKN